MCLYAAAARTLEILRFCCKPKMYTNIFCIFIIFIQVTECCTYNTHNILLCDVMNVFFKGHKEIRKRENDSWLVKAARVRLLDNSPAVHWTSHSSWTQRFLTHDGARSSTWMWSRPVSAPNFSQTPTNQCKPHSKRTTHYLYDLHVRCRTFSQLLFSDRHSGSHRY